MPDFRPAGPLRPDDELFPVRTLLRLMQAEFDRAARHGHDLACLCVAVDRLGGLQDLYGREARESILEKLRATLERKTRAGDFPLALVDHAFVVLFPHTAPEVAERLAERLLGAVQIEVQADGRSVTLTLSAGLSGNREPGVTDSATLLQRARAGLALARSAGGGQWMRAEQGSGELERLRRELEELREAMARQDVGTRSIETDLELDLLRRRVAKLTESLRSTEEELRRVLALKDVDSGIASMYRSVQGLSADATNAKARLEMLSAIYESNLELQRRLDPPGN